ncbi:MAG: hypothetical protein HY683_06650 [Chloroflexi bacterium]|nr:hypothetical protein [Chloroflexota bacterium]
MDFIQGLPKPVQDVFRVALASVMVEFSNYTYEPSLGSRTAAGKTLVTNAPVGQTVSEKLGQIVEDIEALQLEVAQQGRKPRSHVYCASFFDAKRFVRSETVDLVVTSPPYMNNYHYVRNTRPQLFWTGLITSVSGLKRLEEENFGKFWQTVRASAPVPLQFHLPSLEQAIRDVSQMNPDRGVYGGGGWANYIASYMNDLYRFCGLLAELLRIGGTAVIVVGNSVIQGKEIKVEEYLCEIAASQKLSVVSVVKLRTRVGSSIVNSGARLAGASKPSLYDAAVVLRREGRYSTTTCSSPACGTTSPIATASGTAC